MVGNDEEFEEGERKGSFGAQSYKSKVELWKGLLNGEYQTKDVIIDMKNDKALIETDEGTFDVKINLGSRSPIEPIGVQRKGESVYEFF